MFDYAEFTTRNISFAPKPAFSAAFLRPFGCKLLNGLLK